MKDDNLPEEVVSNDRALNKLVRAVTLSQGNFSLILARCNYRSLRDRVVEQLKESCPIPLQEVHLPTSTKTLYTTIQNELWEQHPQALMVLGLEQVKAIDQLLISANQVREEFRKQFSFPIVLWVHDDTLKRIIQLMPDFKSWTGNAIRFEITPLELAQSLQQPLAELLTALLEVGEGRFLKLADLDPRKADLGEELTAALADLPAGTDDRLLAKLQFWVGREADLRGVKIEAKAYYEQSIGIWQRLAVTPTDLSAEDWASYGCGLFHLGLWWRQYATQHRREYREACSEGKRLFQESLAAFDRTNRPELAAKFINVLGEVLLRLGLWDELATVVQRAVQLHQTYPEPIRLAFAYGLAAEVALHRQDWATVKAQAELALSTNDLPSPSAIDWSLDCAQRKNFYLLLLAEAKRHLNEEQAAIEHLETAKANFQAQYDPTVYIRILGTLRSLYFDKGQYLQAFEAKQEQRSIEQQYGLRAFVGAGRLQSRRQVMNPALALADTKAAVTQEIAASGRLQDVKRLVERIGRTDHKLTVIYGQSGVGKSSLVQAGLVPALRQQSIEARDVVPVLLQVYTDWTESLNRRLVESLEEVQGLSLPLFLDSMAAFVEEIKQSDNKNLLTVLIFDQFEEFFFAYKNPLERRPFFEFLRDCLNVPYVKVILSLREDYLHYLLECDRLARLDVIDNNILDKKILYYLGNFSPQDGRAVIQSLTEASQFELEVGLVDELVQDLAGELQEVRPIELQVVGAQMQTEQVTTLEKYLETGPKERFVGRFLEEVVKDCGANNESFAKIILYLLTDDNLTRPLKTRAELETDLAIPPERLDLILQILVKSGLVFQVPGFPADRYQLVHDYLVPFVRQQQAAGLVAELEKEREQRKLTEEKLNQALKKQLKTARRGVLTFAGLAVAVGGIAIAAIVTGINLYIYGLGADAGRNKELDKVISAIKACKTLKAFPVAIPEIRLPVLMEANNAIANLNELNRLEGHTSAVNQVTFSPNGELIASISDDETAKVWNVSNGALLTTLKGSQGKGITSVSFSSDSKQIAFASKDQTVRIRTINGQELQDLATQGTANSISFSPNSKLIAVSVSKNIILWDLTTGKKVHTFTGHTGNVTSVSLSPDGRVLASADQDDTVKLWDLGNKKVIRTIDNYGTIGIQFSADGKMLILANKDQSVKHYALDGTIVKNFEPGDSRESIAVAIGPDGKLIASANRDENEVNLSIDRLSYNDLALKGHVDRITSLGFSPDGKILASASQDRTIRLWKANEKKSSNPEGRILKMQFTPDSQTIVAALSDRTIQLFDRQGHWKRTIIKGVGHMFSLNPEGTGILTRSAEDRIKLWRLDEQERTLKSYPDGIASLEMSPDGKTIIAIGNDGSAMFWNEDKLIKTESKNGEKIRKINFSPNSELIALSGENQVILWRKNGTRMSMPLAAHTSETTAVTFSPDSDLVATIGDDNLIQLSRKDGTLVRVLKGHTDRLISVNFSPNSQIIVSVSVATNNERRTIKLWNRNGKLIETLDGQGIQGFSDGQVTQRVPFSPDNRTIAIINQKKIIQLVDIAGKQIATLSHNGEVTDLSFSPDGQFLASASADETIRLWHQDGRRIKILRGHNSPVQQVMFNPVDGQTFASLSRNGMLRLWTRDGTPLKTLQPANEENIGEPVLRYSQDGQKIIFTGFVYSPKNRSVNYVLKFWSRDGQELKDLQRQVDSNQTLFSTNGKNIAWVESDQSLKLWNLQGAMLATFSGHQSSVNAVAFSPDGKLLASASDDKTVRLWTREGRILKQLDHSDKVNDISFSADSQLLASASDDHTVKLWTREGNFLKQLSHGEKVNAVRFSPNSNFLASAGDDKMVKFWTQIGHDSKSPLKDSDKISNIEFSPDGKLIATVNQGNIGKLWKISGEKADSIPTEYSGLPVFNSDSTISVTASLNAYPPTFQISMLHGMWDPSITLSNQRDSSRALQFSPDRTLLAAAGNDLTIIDFDLDRLLSKACSLARNYLKNNQKVKESDRRLCDGIPDPK